MTFAARITHTPTGLALTFAEPVSRIDMAPDVAGHLASLLAVEARSRMLRVVAKLDDHQTDSNSAKAVALRPLGLITNAHPLCCDCDGCLNGEHHA